MRTKISNEPLKIKILKLSRVHNGKSLGYHLNKIMYFNLIFSIAKQFQELVNLF